MALQHFVDLRKTVKLGTCTTQTRNSDEFGANATRSLYISRINACVKIGHQSCVYANTIHTELELCTPMGVGVVFTERRQLAF